MTATADGSQISLVIDDYEAFPPDAPSRPQSSPDSSKTPLIIPASPIYFGGIPDNYNLESGATATDTSFSGCIGDTTINGKLINYASSTGNQGASVSKCHIPDSAALGGGSATNGGMKPVTIDDEDGSSTDSFPEPESTQPTRQPSRTSPTPSTY